MFSTFQSFIFIFFTSIDTYNDKLVFAKLFKKFPAIYGTRSFMSMLTEVRHWAIYTMNRSNISQILIYKGKLWRDCFGILSYDGLLY